MITKTIVIFTVMISLGFPTPSFATSVGDKCRKVGVKKDFNGKVLICSKKGKKLSWKVDIQSDSNSFQKPFPDNFTRKQLVNRILLDFEEYERINAIPKQFKFVIDSKSEVKPVEVEKFLERIYAVLPFPKDYPETIIVVSQDRDLTEREISSFGLSRVDSNQAAGAPCLNCAGERWASSENGLAAVTPHEIFHIW